MNNVMDMLIKSGYEASTIGADVLPCTITKDNEPIGFLMDDLSLRLLPDKEPHRQRIESVISFAAENQGLETVQNEFKLSQYKDIVFTAAYDYDEGKPFYNIYSIDADKNLTLFNSSYDKDKAAQEFVSRSGLASGQIPTPARSADRIGDFINEIKAKGYALAENIEDSHISYDITDKNENIVGYIDKNNRVTVISENSKIKRALNNAYINTNPDKIMLTPFFEKLKNRLKEIGLALKVFFTGSGRHYAIHDSKHQEIATVSETHQVAYTPAATDVQMAKIDALVEEIKRENLEKENQKSEKEAVQPEKVMQKPAAVDKRQEQPAFTNEDVQSLTGAVLMNKALTASLIGVIMSDKDFIAQLQGGLAQKLQEFSGITQPITAVSKTAIENPKQKAISNEFFKDYSLLQTLDGFNTEQFETLKNQMVSRFGTADTKEFTDKLSRGEYAGLDSLAGKLSAAQKEADFQNAKITPVRTEQTKERE